MDGIAQSMHYLIMKKQGTLEEKLGRMLHLDSTGEFQDMPEHFMARSNPINYLVIWVLGGRGFARTEGQRWTAKAGDLLVFRPDVAHEYGADPVQPWHILWVHYSGRLAPLVTDAMREHGGSCVRLGLDDRLAERWRELVMSHGSSRPGMTLQADADLHALLGRVVAVLRQRAGFDGKEAAFDLHKVQLYIHEHLDQPITLAMLARLVNLSPTHFARVFRKHQGVAPIDYVIQKRMMLAASLLADTSLPLKHICVRVGYGDPFYFSRLFKKVTGLSPMAFRHSVRGKRSPP
jgi:AraC-like DNA-binding protein